MNDDREVSCGCHFKLDPHDLLLLFQKFLGPVAVQPDFSDCPYAAVKICLHMRKLLLPVSSDRSGVQAEAREYHPRMSVRKIEHRISALRIYVGEDYAIYAGFSSTCDGSILLAGKGLVIKMGMCVYKLHCVQCISCKCTQISGKTFF